MALIRRIAFIMTSYGYAEPFGVMHLATIAKKHGWDVRLFQTATDSENDIIGYHPNVLAYSVLSSQAEEILTFNRRIRKRLNAISIMGGHHPTYFPDVVNDADIDVICVGEGEIALGEFLDNFDNRNSWNEIRNLSTYPRIPPLNPLITDYCSIGFADRDIIYANPLLAKQKMKSFYATRGCPFHCSYCMNHAFNRMYEHNGPPVRRREVAHIIDEIKTVHERWPLEFVRFNDDCFALVADDWMEAFTEQYSREIALPFWVQVRPDKITERTLRLLKLAGCHVIGTSFESANPLLRERLLKRGTSTNDDISRGFALMHKFGFRTQTNCMLGLPGGTLEDDLANIEFMVDNKIDLFSTTIFQPFQGTELYDYCVENNIVPIELKDYFPTSNWNYSILTTFSYKEKKYQYNLTRFTPLIGLFPKLKRLCCALSKLPPNPIFDVIFFVARHLAWKKVIPLRLDINDIVGFLRVTLGLHFIKQTHKSSK